MPDGVRPPTTGTGFIYDRRDLMQETDGFGGDVDLMYAGATDEIYGDLISEGDGDGLIHFYDAMGSTVALADGSSGDVLDRYKYTAFGQLYAADIDGGGWAAPSGDPASATLAFGKKRYYADSESALFLLGAGGGKDDRGGNVSLAGRYYDPVVGRFVSDDPGRQSGGDINMQRYVGNDPVNKLDPSGQDDDYNPFKWAWHHRQGAFYYAERAAGIDPATANEGAKEFKAESQAVKNTAFMVAGMAIEGITESEKALFEDALKFAGKTAEELVSAIKPFTEEVVTTVRTLIKHSDLIWASVKTGMFAGLTEFMGVDLSDDKISLGTKAEKVAEKLGDELGNLFGVSDLVGLLKQFFAGGKNVEEVAAEIGLKLVGYDWDSILGVVSEELGPFGSMAIGFVTALVGEVADQGGVWAGIKHMVADGEKAAESAAADESGAEARRNAAAARKGAAIASKKLLADQKILQQEMLKVWQAKKSKAVAGGPLKGRFYALTNMESKTVDFIKQKDDLYNDLRDDFDSSIRSNFIKMLYNDASCLPNLKASGISDAAIAAMKTGAVPATHEVHHKIPLRQGGTNDKENLVLIKKDPWHKVITNLQNSLQVGMKIGEKRTITNWPWPKGNIYPT